MPRCIAYKADGTLCAGQGIELDEKRGGFVCAVHPPLKKELQRELDELDRESNKLHDKLNQIWKEQNEITLAKRGNQTLVVESPKILANLRPIGNIGGWARRHFGERVRQLTEIHGVALREVWPAHSSTTCLRCHYSDKANRRGTEFRCVRCGSRGHADVVASRNLVRRARGDFFRVDKAALQTRSDVQENACG